MKKFILILMQCGFVIMFSSCEKEDIPTENNSVSYSDSSLITKAFRYGSNLKGESECIQFICHSPAIENHKYEYFTFTIYSPLIREKTYEIQGFPNLEYATAYYSVGFTNRITDWYTSDMQESTGIIAIEKINSESIDIHYDLKLINCNDSSITKSLSGHLKAVFTQ